MAQNSARRQDNVDSKRDCQLLYETLICGESEIIRLRSKLRAVGRRLGFPEARLENMALVAAEMASNLVKHANGRGAIQLWQQPGVILDITSLDCGPGIADTDKAQEDGYSSVCTLGKGFGSMRRLSNGMGLYSQVGPAGPRNSKWRGTLAWARFARCPSPVHRDHELGLFVRSMVDEHYSGDRIYVYRQPGRVRWLHMDGLGHGAEAQLAGDGFDVPLLGSVPLPDLIARVTKRLRHTRGAVGVAGELDEERGILQILGVGDITLYLWGENTLRTIGFCPGILGREHATPKLQEFAVEPGMVIITTSDGIRRSWNGDTFAGLRHQSPQTIAYLIGNVMSRLADDRSVFALRHSLRKE